MQLVRFGPETGRPIDRFGSSGVRLAPLVAERRRSSSSTSSRGGRLGRHPAVVRQLLAVVAGAGSVSGGDGVEHPVAPGIAAVWEAGEEHETRTDWDLTAVVVEGDGLDVLAAP